MGITINCSGTLGDVYIIVLKLMKFGNKLITIYHKTSNVYWYSEIRSIYSLLPNVEIEFVDPKKPDMDYPKIDALSIDIKPEYFPQFKLESRIEKPYIILLTNSGKPRNIGKNTKELNPKWIQNFIDNNKDKIVLLGTNDIYLNIHHCINLVNKTSVLEAMSIVANAESFIGPAGLLSYVALSNKRKSVVFCGNEDVRYINNTPWEFYCNLIRI